MNIKNVVNGSFPLISLAGTAGIIYSGASKSLIGKALTVAVAISPIVYNMIDPFEVKRKNIKENVIMGFISTGLFTVAGTGIWLASQTELISKIAIFVLDFFSNQNIPLEAYDHATLYLKILMGMAVSVINIGLSINGFVFE